jgi:CBS domain-containing protein
MHRVKDVMTAEVITCRPESSLELAVQSMIDRGCGCVVVVNEARRVEGLVTDRDALVCAARCRLRLAAIRVSAACSRAPICCEEDDTIERAEMLMRTNQVRRLPVVGPDRVLVGVISLTDIARHVERSVGGGSTELSPRDVVVVLSETSGVHRARPPRRHWPAYLLALAGKRSTLPSRVEGPIRPSYS